MNKAEMQEEIDRLEFENKDLNNDLDYETDKADRLEEEIETQEERIDELTYELGEMLDSHNPIIEAGRKLNLI